MAFPLRRTSRTSVTSDTLDQYISNHVNAANFSAKPMLGEPSSTARKDGSFDPGAETSCLCGEGSVHTGGSLRWEATGPPAGRFPNTELRAIQVATQPCAAQNPGLVQTAAARSFTHLIKLRWTPRERCTPEQSMHKKTPYVMLAQLGFLAPQSKQACGQEAMS